MKKKTNKIEDLLKKSVTQIENFGDYSNNNQQQQIQENYPPDIQGLFERLGIE